jgi:hypothetical protein
MDEAKRELIPNWLLKASHDLAAARVLTQGDQPILDVAIYLCSWPMQPNRYRTFRELVRARFLHRAQARSETA